jgi:DNA-binding HxlR family transcriptional regulator
MTSLTHAQKTTERRSRNGWHRSADAIEAPPGLAAPLEAQVAVLDDYWNAPILTEVLSGANRFRRIARNLQITSPTLAERLRGLVGLGIIERRVWSEQDVEYQVTETGRRLLSLWVQKVRRGDVASLNGSRAAKGHDSASIRGNGVGSAPLNGNGAHLELTDREAQRALGLLGVRWNLLILGQLYLGRHRFNEIKHAIGVTNRTLSERLKGLVDNGILERRQYQASRYEYWLTPRGRALLPAVAALFDWAHASSSDTWQSPETSC